MNKKLIPTFMVKDVFNIHPRKLNEMGVLFLFVDLDNTLSSPYVDLPDERVFNWINELKKWNIDVTVLSNNHEERVKKFVTPLGVHYLSNVKKPRTKKVKEYLCKRNINVQQAIAIGDQIMTDVLMAKKLNMRVILVEPLTKRDEPITFFPRLLDSYFRKKIKKKKLVG